MRTILTTNYKENAAVYPRLCYSSVLGIEDKQYFKIGPRAIDDYILVFVTKGIFVCEQGDFYCHVSEGEYILIDLHERHKYCFEADIPSEIYWMHINGHQVFEMIESLKTIAPMPFWGRDEKVLEYIKMAIHLQQPNNTDAFAYSLHITNTLMHILRSAYSCLNGKKRSPEELKFRETFEKLLSVTPIGELSLQTMSQHMHLSKYYFSHLFKQYYAMPPMKYLLCKKLEKAKNLLEHTEYKIASISGECGFSSADYFSTAFQREYGVSPKEYRALFMCKS